MNWKQTILLMFGVLMGLCIYAQPGFSEQEKPLDSVQVVSSKYLDKVSGKAGSIEQKLDRKSAKAIGQLQKRERKIQQKMAKLDSIKAKELLANAKEQYAMLEQHLQKTSSPQQYIPSLDSLSTSLKFLQQNTALLSTAKQGQQKLKDAMTKVNGVETQFRKAEDVKAFLKERRQYLKEQITQSGIGSFTKELKKMNKQLYYYGQQVGEYEEMLKNPSKAERKALSLLNKLPAFQKFMRKNSQLASLFRMTDNYGSSQSLAGLQTRASVQGLIQQRIAAGGPNAKQIVQQNIAQARSEMDKLKNKLNQSGGGNSDLEIPDFKNNQKTKSLLKRLEYGFNVQFAKNNSLMPTTTDIGLSLGYKLNDKSIIGIGLSYKMGIGSIRHIAISHQGIGLRSFADYKIRKSLFLSGGYEMNYNAAFKNIEQLKGFNDRQSTGFIGLSKKYSVSKKVKGEMKLLYDFLCNTHTPVSQPIVFRLGYKLIK